MSDLSDFLLERIAEMEERATERDQHPEYRQFPFFKWLPNADSVDLLYGRNQTGHFQPHEVELLRLANPTAIREECARKRRIVEDCAAALTFAAAPGMESARILAERVLQQLAQPYIDHPNRPRTIKRA